MHNLSTQPAPPRRQTFFDSTDVCGVAHNCLARHCVGYMHMSAPMHAHKHDKQSPSLRSLASVHSWSDNMLPDTTPHRHHHRMLTLNACSDEPDRIKRSGEERNYMSRRVSSKVSFNPLRKKRQIRRLYRFELEHVTADHLHSWCSPDTAQSRTIL